MEFSNTSLCSCWHFRMIGTGLIFYTTHVASAVGTGISFLLWVVLTD